MTSFQKSALAIASFYEDSAKEFHPTLKHLDQIVENLIDATEVNLKITMQIFQLKDDTGQPKIKTFNLTLTQLQNVTDIFTILRNFNGEGQRNELIDEGLRIEFDIIPVR